ncbi:MAG: acyl-CoA thioesterase [Flavobacteriales bacterium]|nr:acyl-CoA thioesterase [Flavobacteriales bacterium]
MFQHDAEVRVRYGETDQMGYVYYGDYAEYFEVGRVEALRSLGFAYRRLEEQGVMLPVRDMRITYHKPARYDDLLVIRTRISALPDVRIGFDYEVINGEGVMLCEATTTLIFVDSTTMRPRRAPEELLTALRPYFTS